MEELSQSMISYKSKNKEQLNKFVKKVTNQENKIRLSLNELYPCPKELLDTSDNNEDLNEHEKEQLIRKYGYSDRRDWCENNWGTERSHNEFTTVSMVRKKRP